MAQRRLTHPTTPGRTEVSEPNGRLAQSAMGNITVLLAHFTEVRSWRLSAHTAPFYRLYFVTEGTPHIVTPKGTMKLSPRIPWLVPAGAEFRSDWKTPYTKLYIHFNIEWPGLVPSPEIIPLKDRALVKDLESLVKDFALTPRRDRPKQSGPGNDLPALKRWANLHRILATVVTLLHPESVSFTRVSPRVMASQQRMRQNLAEPLPIRSIAGSVGMTPSTFIRLFHREVGQPPAGWYRGIRLAEAASLLGRGDVPIEEVARRTGFYDRNHFTRVFAEMYHVAPAHFRRISRAV